MPKEPLPDSGWSRDIQFIKNAIVCPAPTIQDAPGIWRDGRDFAKAATWRSGIRCTPEVKEEPTPARKIVGKHLWGGIYFGHFGHFITETISRLWALDLDRFESVVFVPRHGKLEDFTNYKAEIANIFLKGHRIEIVRQPTEFEELVVPGQGFGIGAISSGTPEFRAFVNRTMEKIEPNGPESIYISRTQFYGKGGIIGEKFLERNMLAQGYTPIYPEKMPIPEQLSVFKAARKIVGLDSSAFHLLSYVSNPDQQACIILRRSHDAYKHIADHLAAFSGREPLVIDSIVANWMPGTQQIPNHVSWGELDEVALVNQLVENGFIKDANLWTYMTKENFDEGRVWSETRHKISLIRRSL
ncbi:glycosyltransferase 61 family protein [Paracoccus sp. (in: a-proteobacteria)]|uniref:glycosyltransferase 61 family protein n=1 Tax=Paracoccus sp. TaxID=267 RepID=UPI0028B0021B|nr:glycosyltransferase 61 family protein [Paracoccus sp. (in: a-proteobacteria)]